MNEIYTTNIFDEWLSLLKDKVAQAAIRKRIHKAELGNFGKVRFLRDGLWEMKIDISGGYRLYYKQTGNKVYLIAVGGDKSTQDKDIETALRIIQELSL